MHKLSTTFEEHIGILAAESPCALVLEWGRRLELAALTPTVAKVFRLTRMDTVFTIHDSVPNGLPSVV